LNSTQHLNVFLVVRDPELNRVLEVWPHQCRVQEENHFPSPAGHTIPDTIQDTKKATWSHYQLIFSWLSTNAPRSFSSRQLSCHSSPNQ